jgi:preprotein translocase subunit SecA
MAENYVKFFKKTIKSGQKVIAKVYSEVELNLIVEALMEEYNLSNFDSNKVIEIEDGTVAIQKATKRKANTDWYAKVIFNPSALDTSKETLEKDIFFGLFILGTEKHESRRIDNQLRGRA